MVNFLRCALVGIYFLLFSFSLIAQNFANKDFYLVDSLVLEDLPERDKKLLDSCLTVYHATEHDTSKISTLALISGNMMHIDKSKYTFLQLYFIKELMKTNPSDIVFHSLKKSLIITLNEIGGIYQLRGKVNKALAYYKKALWVSKKMDDKRGMAFTLNNLGNFYDKERNDASKALTYLKQSLQLSKETAYKEIWAASMNNMASVYFALGDIPKAIDFYDKSRAILEELGSKKNVAIAFLSVGIVHRHQGNMAKALKCFQKSLKGFEDTGFKRGIASSLISIGIIYESQGLLDNTLELYYRGLAIQEEIGSKKDIIYSLNNIGVVHKKKGNSEKAKAFYDRAIKLAFKIDHRRLVSMITNNIGEIYHVQGNFDMALKYYHQDRILKEDMNDKLGLAINLVNTGEVYIKQQKFHKAVEFMRHGLKIGKKMGIPEVTANAAGGLSEIYENQNQHEKSLEMYKLYTQMKDSMNSREAQKLLAQHKNKAALEKRDQQIILMKKEKRLKDTRFQLFTMMYGLVLTFLIALTLIFVRHKKKKYENELNILRVSKIEEQRKNEDVITSIPITMRKKVFSVKIENVVYFKGEGRYVFLRNKMGKSYIIDYTLTHLEKSLPDSFLRIHRSYIINTSEILEINKELRGKVTITMKEPDKTKLTSSLSYNDAIKHLIENFDPDDVKG